jgi:hypothetical protein
MRFKKIIRSPYEDTRRKRLAALRSQQRERDRFPLLADHIKDQQPGLDEIMARRAEQWEQIEATSRNSRAEAWRKARRLFYTFDAETRRIIRFYWNSHRWYPGDPSYFSYVLKCLQKGTLIKRGGTLEPVSVTISVSQSIDRIEGVAPPKPLMLPGLHRKAPKPAGRA